MLFYLVSKGKISGIEKTHAIYFSKKGHLFILFANRGASAPVAPGSDSPATVGDQMNDPALYKRLVSLIETKPQKGSWFFVNNV